MNCKMNMEDLFNEFSLNKSMEEIEQIYMRLHDYDFFLRMCIKNYVSRLLMDTSEEKHIEIKVCLEEKDPYGLPSCYMPWVTQIWQHPSEGIITTEVDDGEFDPDDYTIVTERVWTSASEEVDFDEYNTEEQMEILKGLLWTLNSR